MSDKNRCSEQTVIQRRRVEEITSEIKDLLSEDLEVMPPEKMRRLFHKMRVHQIKLEMQNEELRRRLAEYSAARTHSIDLYDLAPVGYYTVNEKGMILEANLTAATLLGVDRGTLINQPLSCFVLEEDRDIYNRYLHLLIKTGEPQSRELQLLKSDGMRFYAQLDATVMQTAGVLVCHLVMSDITGRKRAEDRERLARDVLASLNHSECTTDSISEILQVIQKSTGFEAVGIRLREGEDFPYYQTIGFPDSFVEMERYLCVRDETGQIVRDTQGQPVLACMCGNILSGRTNPKFSFFTEGGSFWSNCTTDLLASTTEEDLQIQTRNHCNRVGYESVALIPLRADNEIIGLLQLNDHRRNRFTRETIYFFEGLGASIGIALRRMQAEEKLHEVNAILQTALDQSPAGIAIADAPDGTVRYVNHAGRLIRSGNSHTIGNGVGINDHEDNPQLLDINGKPLREDEKPLARAILFGESCSRELVFRRTAGDDRILCVNAAPVTNAKGQITAGVVVFLDITEGKRAEDALRLLSSRLLTSQEEEQRRIAMELHDQTGQDLNVLKMHLTFLQSRLRKDQNHLKEEFDTVLTFIDNTIEDVRRLAHGLSPSQLQALGLCAAIKALIRNFSGKTNIPIYYDVEALDKALPAGTRIILYRIFQEALTNIHKHARAKTVRIDVCRRDHTLSITIKDDGQGFDPGRYRMSEPTIERGMGLSALELRAKMIGADLKIFSHPGQGTEIRLILPDSDKRPDR